MNARSELRVIVCPQLSSVSSTAWDALLEPDDAPLLSWAYLQGLEETGCVGEHSGWLPLHLLVYRVDDARADETDGQLVAAAPAYVKLHSDGEWVWDQEWTQLSSVFGEHYYPKLVLAVPFNPVTGGRLLTLPHLPDSERHELRALLLRAAQHLCESEGFSSAHLLFPRGPGYRENDRHLYCKCAIGQRQRDPTKESLIVPKSGDRAAKILRQPGVETCVLMDQPSRRIF